MTTSFCEKSKDNNKKQKSEKKKKKEKIVATYVLRATQMFHIKFNPSLLPRSG